MCGIFIFNIHEPAFTGASSNGGGGGGGRIALYHTDENHFSGQMFVHGGYAAQQYGGSGTIYVEDQSNSSQIYRKITADNGGYTDSARILPVQELLLRPWLQSSGTSIRSYSNISVMANGGVWSHHYLRYIFDGSLDTSYISSQHQVNVTLTFPYPTLVSHLHVFPLCR